MSQKELNEQDNQVMSMVNRAAAPDSARNAEVIAKTFSAGIGSPKAALGERRNLLYLALRVVSCLLIASVFMVASESPIFAQTLCAVGFLAAMMTGAIIVDRHFRR